MADVADPDATDTAEEAAFRRELRGWLEVALAELPWPEPRVLEERLPFWRQWQRLLHDAGYAGLGWPVEHGGRGAGVMLQAILAEELDRAGAPDRLNTIGESFAGPTIMACGTPEQQAAFLPRILTGEDVWCQLFSEPEAGSDLASMRTRADRVDGGFVVNGQKVWTSRAQVAAHAILLARTGGGPRHRGISYFLLPMHSPGVTVRPIRQMLGDEEFNEVLLEDVVVPDHLLVGAVDGGWRVARATLGFERVAIATGRVNTRHVMAQILELIRAGVGADGRPLGADPHVRRRAAELYGRTLCHHLTAQRILEGIDAGAPPGPESSIGKLVSTPLVEDLADFALSLHGLDGQLAPEGSPAERWLRLAYQARGTAIAGGTTFIQRSIVAERVLGMPRSS